MLFRSPGLAASPRVHYRLKMEGYERLSTSQPEPGFTAESRSARGDVAALRAAFEDLHP